MVHERLGYIRTAEQRQLDQVRARGRFPEDDRMHVKVRRSRRCQGDTQAAGHHGQLGMDRICVVPCLGLESRLPASCSLDESCYCHGGRVGEPKLVRSPRRPLSFQRLVQRLHRTGRNAHGRFHLPADDAVRPLNHLDGIGELRSQQANRGTVLPVRQCKDEVALRMPLDRGDI